jgi:hypothetical protein
MALPSCYKNLQRLMEKKDTSWATISSTPLGEIVKKISHLEKEIILEKTVIRSTEGLFAY